MIGGSLEGQKFFQQAFKHLYWIAKRNGHTVDGNQKSCDHQLRERYFTYHSLQVFFPPSKQVVGNGISTDQTFHLKDSGGDSL